MDAMQRFVVFAVALGLLTHCQDYKFEQLCPETITEQEISRAAAQPTPADILFVVDNSGSMADEQDNLAANFEFFINQIAGGDSDYRIAVVSMDQDNNIEKQGRIVTNFAQGPYRERLDTERDACTDSTPAVEAGCFRGPDPATRIISTKTMSRDDQIRIFQQNVGIGSCGSGSETGLSASIDALQSAQNGCNTDFLRPEANLVVIYLSDEQDTDNTPLATYIAQLSAIKPPEKIRLAAIVGFADGEANDCSVGGGAQCGDLCGGPAPPRGSGNSCGGGCPAGEVCDQVTTECVGQAYLWWERVDQSCKWCSYFDVDNCCSALSGSRYVRFLRNMETVIASADASITANGCAPAAPGDRSACLIDSICQDNFGETLERIAKDLVIDTTFSLSPPAENPAGVRARIRGGRFPEGRELVPGEDFTVTITEGKGTSVELEKAEIIPQGEDEKIEIFYVSEIEQPTEMMGACGPQNTP